MQFGGISRCGKAVQSTLSSLLYFKKGKNLLFSQTVWAKRLFHGIEMEFISWKVKTLYFCSFRPTTRQKALGPGRQASTTR